MAALDHGSAQDSSLSLPAGDRLRDVLVVTVRKSFWASPECEIFPHRVYAPIVWGHSTNYLNTLCSPPRSHSSCFAGGRGSSSSDPPLGSSRSSSSSGASASFRSGIIATTHAYFGRRLGRYADRVIVYSHQEGEGWDNSLFLPIPADGDFGAVVPYADDVPYVFSGGGTLRDFRSLIAAVAELDIRLNLVTFSPETLDAEERPPEELPRLVAHAAGALSLDDGRVALRGRSAPAGCDHRRAHDDRAGPVSRQGGRHDPRSRSRGLRRAMAEKGCSSTPATSPGIERPYRRSSRTRSSAARANAMLEHVRRSSRTRPSLVGSSPSAPRSSLNASAADGRGPTLPGFDLVIATVDRIEPLERLLDSLERQSHGRFAFSSSTRTRTTGWSP